MTSTNRGKRALRYLRVSRSDQDPALQADATGRLIEGRGWSLVDTVVDHGVSGAKTNRPGLRRVMDMARRGEFDVLIVYRADRLFRSLPDMVRALSDLAALNVEFVSVTEPFDTTPSGKLMIHLVSAFAQFERDVLIERTRDGIFAARKRGVRVGRPRVLVDVDAARQMRSTGATTKTVAAKLGCGVTTLRRALAAEAHAREIAVEHSSADEPVHDEAASAA